MKRYVIENEIQNMLLRFLSRLGFVTEIDLGFPGSGERYLGESVVLPIRERKSGEGKACLKRSSLRFREWDV